MNESLNIYLNSTKVTPSVIESKLLHPNLQKTYPTRYVYIRLKMYAKDFFVSGNEPRMLGLAGIRGVGKTTLLWQLAKYIYNNQSTNAYFFNVNTLDTIGVSLFDTLEVFQSQILKQRFNTLK